MTTLAAEKPDVFITMRRARPCTQIHHRGGPERHEGDGEVHVPLLGLQGDRRRSRKDKVGGDGSADGWWIVGRRPQGHRRRRPTTTTPSSSAARKLLADAGYDYKDPICNLGHVLLLGAGPGRS